MTRSFSLLVNPASGGGAAPDAVVPVAGALRAAGASVEVTYSPGPAAIGQLVHEAVGRGDVVVSVGGDGMLSGVVGPVAEAGGTLGIVPAGRGNDFARMLGIYADQPTDPAALARVLLEAPVSRVDLLEVVSPAGRRVVAGSVYAGVDARAAAYVDAMKHTPRPLQYPIAAVRALLTYTPAHYRVVMDGEAHEFDAATVVVANSGYYGNGMLIAPDARVEDGLLDVVVIEAASKRMLVRSLPKVYDGAHVALPEVTLLRGSRVELSASAARAVPVGGDGEPLGELGEAASDGTGAWQVSVQPGALAVLK